MASCRHCKSTVLLGGYRDGDRRYCNETCYSKDLSQREVPEVPDDLVEATAREVREGLCPRCQGRGPVEVHTSYRVLSAVVVTAWRNSTHVCCRSCGRTKQLHDLALTTFLGWWGFPVGLLMTPVYIVRGLVAVASGNVEEDAEPSAALRDTIRQRLAFEMMEEAEHRGTLDPGSSAGRAA